MVGDGGETVAEVVVAVGGVWREEGDCVIWRSSVGEEMGK